MCLLRCSRSVALLHAPTVSYTVPSLLMCLWRCSRSVALLCSYCVLYCTQSVDVSLEVLQVRGAALLLLLQLVNVPEDSVQLIPILRPGSTYLYH